ncbi:hypothetical protein JQ596_30915 [Bradyrhizobium manausense]|uniref:hypothetical protein n=1 Tax=Bradyrhizobium TaxID=374 RepID=UPI001BACB827|nr:MULTISPECIES: hypothetical protein [Bradyrhizobium]MBR0829949.1 hypothetical protein [Bradyrhizobium manausense]UVO27689.1 hypothetical protein KUF59_35255 [Bradyrhizobium arachidis]
MPKKPRDVPISQRPDPEKDEAERPEQGGRDLSVGEGGAITAPPSRKNLSQDD